MNRYEITFLKNIILVLFFMLLSVPVSTQSTDKIFSVISQKNNFRDFTHNSKTMRREMSYRIIFPDQYEPNRQKRFPVIYLIHGLGGNFKNWTDLTKIDETYSKNYDFIIVMPDGGNGWYSDSVNVPFDKYESYLTDEFIPLIDKRFRTLADKNGRIIAGLSMGGYGAVKFGLKYPEKFALVGSFSGAFDAPLRLKNHPQARDSINEVFGGDENKARQTNDIFKILRDKNADEIKRLPFFYIDCGTEDHLFQTNRDFVSLLNERNIPHEYRELPGVHNWDYWDSQVEEFLQVADKFINRKSRAANN